MISALRSSAAAALLSLACSGPGHAAPPANPGGLRAITLEDSAAIREPGAPRMSPDRRWVAYTVEGQVMVAAVSGGAVHAVTSAGSHASDPRWSRDGRALYFLSDRAAGTRQLWRLPIADFGEAEQISQLPRGLDSVNLSPDESRLLLAFAGPAAPTAGESDGRRKSPWVITRRQFKEDAGDGYITGDAGTHLYVLDLRTQALRPITAGPHAESEPGWSPDGRTVVFVSNRDADADASYRTDLWLVDADGADPARPPTRLTDDDAVKSAPVFSPDGRSIAFLRAVDGVYAMPQVAVVPASGGAARVLTEALDRWITALRYSPDGQWIYFSYEELGGTQVGRVRVSDGRLETVLRAPRNITAFDVARGGLIATRAANINDGPEIYVFDGRSERRLSDLNGAFLGSVMLGARRRIEFASADGTRIEAFLTLPAGYEPGRRYPTILSIHGGPVGQFAYGYDFSSQYLAAQGYAVIEPNPRGSTGRGQDFVRAIYQTWGITDYADLIAAVDHVIGLGVADPDRLVVTGYSYGGYMTNVVITRTQRFKAAVSGAGHSLIVANFGHDIYQKWYHWELGVPWENEAKYERLSPLRQAGQVQTPTLFLGGRDDWNVPILNAELFYQSLRVRGVQTELVVYPGTHHGGWSQEFERDALLRTRDWFDRHLGIERPPGAAP